MEYEKATFLERLFYYLFGKYSHESGILKESSDFLNNYRTKLNENPGAIRSVLPEGYNSKLNLKEVAQVFLISSESNKSKTIENDESILKLERSNYFKKESVRMLLEEGIQRMRLSIDPVHDWTHVRRVIGYADLIWQKLPTNQRPDWGAVLLSVVWHDSARIDWLGPAEDHFTWLKRIPFGQDFSILYTALRDASRSALLFKRAAKRHNIPRSLRNMLMKGIKSTANRRAKSGIRKMGKLDILPKIIHDADMLDIFSIGRIEDFILNSDSDYLIDKKFQDRYFAIVWFWILPSWEKRVAIPEAMHIRDLIQIFTENYLKNHHKKEFIFIKKVLNNIENDTAEIISNKEANAPS